MEHKSFSKDYYYILGITPEATTEEIQDAYNELFEKYGPHVSVVGQDPEAMIKAFKDVSEAYECLSNPLTRKEYDQSNLPHLQKSHLRALWGKLRGTDTREMPAVAASRDEPPETTMEVQIGLRDAFKGLRKSIRIEEQLPCKECASLKPMQRMQCKGCRGTGSLLNIRDEHVEIPAKAYEHMEIRLPGKGKIEPRTQRVGDLVIVVRIQQHPFFSVLGRDLACTVPITILEAILGGEIEVPTVTGRVFMKIQPLTQTGRVYRLKGLGLGGADLLVTVDVTVPSQISVDEVMLFRKLKEVSTIKNPREEIFRQLSSPPSDETAG